MTPRSTSRATLLFSLLLFLSGCTVYIPPPSPYTALESAPAAIAEDQLLDVAMSLFADNSRASAQEREDPGLAEVRRVESRYMPVLLRNTLERAESWGELYVLPEPGDTHDVLVEGRILESSSHTLTLGIRVRDATGRLWFDRNYTEHVGNNSYRVASIPEMDPFQSLYNRIANDMLAWRLANLDSASVTRIRQVAKVKFGREYAPDLYSGYLRNGRNGRSEVVGLPAQDDPVQVHLANIRKRDRMFQTVLQQQYQDFSRQVHDNYFNYRQSSYMETLFLREQQAASRNQMLAGMMWLGVAYALVEADEKDTNVSDGTLNAAALALAVHGVQQLYMGAQSYPDKSEFLQGLSESFARDAGPKVISLDEEVIILSGTAEEIFQQWKDILRDMFAEDRG